MADKERKFTREWFENVFWYHYKWWFLLGVFVLAVAIFITVEALSTEKYDYTVIIGTHTDISESDAAGVLAAVGESIGDLDGNGKVSINYIAVNLAEETKNNSSYPALSSGNTDESSQNRMMLYLASEEYSLFLLDDETAQLYCALDFFDDRLDDFGIEAEENNPYRVYLGDTGAVKGTALEGQKLYGLIIDWTTVGKGSEKNTEAGVAALKAILAS